MSNIILASASKRRQDILDINNIPYEVIVADIDEKFNNYDSPEQLAMSLAIQKALFVEKKCNKNQIIIAADTVVYKDEILGKPKDNDDAFRMLKILNNNVHYVFTGVAIIEANTYNKITFFDKTIVKFNKLSDNQILDYINNNEVLDKAGAYAIQDVGNTFIDSIKGDYYNVVGLPINKVISILLKDFNIKI